MRSFRRNLSRRDFLKVAAASSAQLAGMLTLGGPLGLRKVFAAADSVSQKRYLVTLQSTSNSGWDAQSFHFSVVPALMDPSQMLPLAGGTYPSEGDVESGQWAPREAGSVGHQDHPNYSANPHFAMGPGSTLFPSSQLTDDLLIWGGAYYREAGHIIGCSAINAGLNTMYAASFSSLAAATWASQNLRPLHYVWIANSIQANRGLLGAYGDPILIPDEDAWNAMIGTDTDPEITAIRTSIDSTLDSILSNTTESSLKRVFSKSQFQAFRSTLASTLRLKAMLRDSSGPDSAVVKLTALKAEYKAVLEALATHAIVTDWKASSDGRSAAAYATAMSTTIDLLSFRFALAEFLITEDLSAVIDIGGIFQDAHDRNKTERATIILNFAGFSHLISKLKATEFPDGSGRNFLDVTTLAAYTEWDRNLFLVDTDRSSTSGPGTGHGKTCSAILAGNGINTGKVVGGLLHSQDTHPSHASTFGSLVNPWTGSTFASRWDAGVGLPINLATGEPDPNGEFPYIESLFPSMVSILDLTMPSQQITQHAAIAALKKG